MPLLIRPGHRHRFRAVLDDAVRLEREAFGDDARPAGSGLDDDALRLTSLDAAGRTAATVRITADPPVDRAAALQAILPRGPHVAELSHLCADPRLAREGRLQALLELRAGLALLLPRRGWTCAVVVGHDRHIQPFILGGLAVQPLGPPVLLPGDSEPSFAVLASDPGLPAASETARRQPHLLDPDEDPALFTRYGDRAVA